MDTDIGGFMFADQFLQFVTKVPSTYVYGFGEHKKDKFRHTFDYRTIPLWARDEAPENVNIRNIANSNYKNKSKGLGVQKLSIKSL